MHYEIMKDKANGISFTSKDQLSANMILTFWEKVTQSNSCLNALDRLVLGIHTVKMPLGFGRGIKTKGRSLTALAHLKKFIVKVKSEINSLAHSLNTIAIISNYPNYKSYRN